MNTGVLLLKWGDFKDDIRASYITLRNGHDFSDVTLSCEDGVQVEAHKVILAACSSVLNNILQNNKHPHPLLFLRGLNHDIISHILDFIYYGEVEVQVEQLNSFLAAAEDLKLKGISCKTESEAFNDQSKISENKFKGDFRTSSEDRDDQTVNISSKAIEEHTFPDYIAPPDMAHLKPQEPNKHFVIEDIDRSILPPSVSSTEFDLDTTSLETKKSEMLTFNNKMEDTQYECTVCGKILKSQFVLSSHAKRHLAGFPTTINDKVCPTCEKVFESKSYMHKHISMHHRSIKLDTKKGFEGLDAEIKPFISKFNGIWICQVCEKQSDSKPHISNHVESRHMDLSLPCLKCGHVSKNRDALRAHCTRYCKLNTN